MYRQSLSLTLRRVLAAGILAAGVLVGAAEAPRRKTSPKPRRSSPCARPPI